MPHQEVKTWTDSTHDPKKEWEKGATPKNLRDELSNAQTELWTVSLYGYLFYNTYSFWPGASLKAWCIFEMCQQIVGSFEKRGCRHVTSDQDCACSFNACSFKQSTNNIYLPPKSRIHFFLIICRALAQVVRWEEEFKIPYFRQWFLRQLLFFESWGVQRESWVHLGINLGLAGVCLEWTGRCLFLVKQGFFHEFIWGIWFLHHWQN